jgi:hypothetical protein
VIVFTTLVQTMPPALLTVSANRRGPSRHAPTGRENGANQQKPPLLAAVKHRLTRSEMPFTVSEEGA